MSKLTSPSAVRRYALATADRIRPAAGFTRVSQDFLDRLESATRVWILDEIHRQPSNGKTIK